MIDKIIIDGIDVTKYRFKWNSDEAWDNAIDQLTLEFSSKIRDTLDLKVGLSIQIYRGYEDPEEQFIIDGQITQCNPEYVKTRVTIKNRLYDAIKSNRVKTWNKNIDDSLGIGSEIFKDLCEASSLDYTPEKNNYGAGSINYTGNESNKIISKFVQNDEDNYEKMVLLAEHYNYNLGYDYVNSRVFFKPKGIEEYPKTLVVGKDIPIQIKWKENMEQMINLIKVQGATVYERQVEEFDGPVEDISLLRTPEDTELRVNHELYNEALLRRGQKDVGELGVDFDYYIEEDQQKVTFDQKYSNIWINYGSQVPLPITLRDTASIDEYGGPNKIPHSNKIAYSDIKDLDDAEERGRVILRKFAQPFFSARDVPIKDSVIKEHGIIKPGMLVTINDPFTNKEYILLVKNVKKEWPHVYDKIDIGDEEWRTEDWQVDQMKNINKIFNELNKNQDIHFQVFDTSREVRAEKRYFELQTRNVAGETGIYGHPIFGLYGTAKYGSEVESSFILGHSSFGILGKMTLGEAEVQEWQTIRMIQGEDNYKELLYDDLFFDDVNSDSGVAWDTTTQEITIPPQQTLYTKCLEKNTGRTTFNVVIGGSSENLSDGDVSITHNNNDWEIINNFNTNINFIDSSTDIRLKIFNSSTTDNIVIKNTISTEEITSPAIRIRFT